MSVRVALVLLVLFASRTLTAAAGVNVTTWRYDATRAGQNVNETQLTPANVNTVSFGKLFALNVDGYVYAQPLYVSGLNIGGAVHNVVFIATQHDSVYAFDADHNQMLWQASLVDIAHGAAPGATSVPSADVSTNDIVPEVGITSTPVIDVTAGTLYVVGKSLEGVNFVHRLHALDLLTGRDKQTPTVITGSVAGAGIGNVNGTISFDPRWQLNRTGLLLFNGCVYVAFAAHGDNGPYHGWIFAFNATTLQRSAVFNASPNGKGNGIWHSGAALAADTLNGVPRMFFATGNFFSTGNGSSNPTPPYTEGQNYSNAIIRLDLSNGGMGIADEWTPYDSDKLSSADTDQTSGGVLVLPDQPGAYPHELIQVGKNGRIELLDRDNLGGFNASYNNIVQEVNSQINGLWSTPAYWNSNVYFGGNADRLKQFTLLNGRLSNTPVASSSVTFGYPGASPLVSANGNADGIVWVAKTDAYNANGPAVLFAYDATNVSRHLYDSGQNASRDGAGKAVKFVVPVVADGKVYMGTQTEVDVYGLFAATPPTQPTAPTPTLSPAPGTYASATSVSIADSSSSAQIYYTTNGGPPSTSSTHYTGPFTVGATSLVQALAVVSGDSNSNVASGTYTIGTAPTIDFSQGFASVKGLTLNGSAVNSDDSRLQLTTGGNNEAGSTFANTAVNVQAFTTDFTFQLSGSPPIADGITFTIQSVGPTALGPFGGGLGYGPDHAGGGGGIARSVAVKFDVYSNAGEGTDSTGLYVNGASPTTPAIDLTASNVHLSTGDVMSAHLAYDGANLTLTIKDPVNGSVYNGKFAIDIPATIGATSGYVGFTGGTGGLTASQKILTWSFTSQPASQAQEYQVEKLSPQSSGPVFRDIAWAGFPDGEGTVLDSTKVGDSVTFTVNFAKAGSYDMHATAKDFNIRAMWQLSFDGANVGTAHDEYSAAEAYVDFDVGTIVINSAGNHTFKFTVVGRNSASVDYKLSFDTLRFIGP